MTEFVVASLLAALTVGYWALCRHRSLPLRERASQLVVEYVERDDVSDADARSIFGIYSVSTKFWFLPLAVIVAVPLMPILALIGKPDDKPTPADKRKIMVSCLLFHIVRNPIISVICLSLIFVWTTFFVAVGLLTRRISSVPSLNQFLDIFSLFRTVRDRHAH
ncbi:hypothetical protein [Pseudomonas sp. S36]|uniref:hypothetical protein n=1 Tax=Pseudomonas sp. S36 TaxID=2767447 RepID=UPI0019117A64|nr:hypothetical protein [Pseudomonas sp. S36]MBK4989798.1 hypothetical protein [Pseudomonas sp. S36]